MTFETVERPATNKRGGRVTRPIDAEVETALYNTLYDGTAVKMPLYVFHSTPAKGRLWKAGLSVRHRVTASGKSVLAWVEEKREEGGGSITGVAN